VPSDGSVGSVTGLRKSAGNIASRRAPRVRRRQTTESFQVKGIIIEVTPKEKRVEIKHEEIPGYMQAMTMPFEVKDANELPGWSRGIPCHSA